MKKVIFVFLIFCFSLTIISSAKKSSTSSSSTTNTTNVIEQMGGSSQGVELSLSTAVTTLAGSTVSPPGSANGTGTSASFSSPNGITTDGTNLYVTELGNMIRQIE